MRCHRINGAVAASTCSADDSRWTRGWQAWPPTTTITWIGCGGPSTGACDRAATSSLLRRARRRAAHAGVEQLDRRLREAPHVRLAVGLARLDRDDPLHRS